jgi:hypothetical protein
MAQGQHFHPQLIAVRGVVIDLAHQLDPFAGLLQ